MENTPLYAQKVTILSRLIKESSLTLEEALLLLKEEEEEIEEKSVYIPSTSTPWTTNPYTQPIGLWPYTNGSGTVTVSTFGSVGLSNTSPASSLTISTSTDTADLNN